MSDEVQINIISANRMQSMNTMEKIRLILDDVMNGHIVILEKGLDPMEEAKLIEFTMIQIRNDVFSGIEIQSYPRDQKKSAIGKLFGKDPDSRMTVIGPANRLKSIKKEKDIISALIA
ncbi:DUF2073 domain-containing protein [Methanocella sp. CWC-04]|uniref:DUF2073 domain-containing protein n=1 Tax=Methanooceanicella nereidis TaxID=2052831 RepID=A0AAP2RBJ5_9EURY|nr:DUF2073 domain-containing protein [Methanocella sp. CWC-04]MCD1294438.1 DUF2073 domain-containing protein [Methanocella sp. CWC-04]